MYTPVAIPVPHSVNKEKTSSLFLRQWPIAGVGKASLQSFKSFFFNQFAKISSAWPGYGFLAGHMLQQRLYSITTGAPRPRRIHRQN